MIYCNVAGERKIIGGLGNNLFKIAAAASLAKKNNDEFSISAWRYDIFQDGVFKFGVDKKSINIENIYYEPYFQYQEIEYKSNMEVVGSFQSEKYFEKQYIMESFKPKQQIKSYIIEKYGALLSKKTCSIHVRRGDYLTNSKRHPVLPEDYYRMAMNKMVDWNVESFIIISDDINWCKNTNVFKNNNVFFVCNEKDYIDLFLMSMCDHNIISNSTFSWWGAWLNGNNIKKVIAPKIWFGPGLSFDTKDVVPEEWIKL